jgi:hypothetical protein
MRSSHPLQLVSCFVAISAVGLVCVVCVVCSGHQTRRGRGSIPLLRLPLSSDCNNNKYRPPSSSDGQLERGGHQAHREAMSDAEAGHG